MQKKTRIKYQNIIHKLICSQIQPQKCHTSKTKIILYPLIVTIKCLLCLKILRISFITMNIMIIRSVRMKMSLVGIWPIVFQVVLVQINLGFGYISIVTLINNVSNYFVWLNLKGWAIFRDLHPPTSPPPLKTQANALGKESKPRLC